MIWNEKGIFLLGRNEGFFFVSNIIYQYLGWNKRPSLIFPLREFLLWWVFNVSFSYVHVISCYRFSDSKFWNSEYYSTEIIGVRFF